MWPSGTKTRTGGDLMATQESSRLHRGSARELHAGQSQRAFAARHAKFVVEYGAGRPTAVRDNGGEDLQYHAVQRRKGPGPGIKRSDPTFDRDRLEGPVDPAVLARQLRRVRRLRLRLWHRH